MFIRQLTFAVSILLFTPFVLAETVAKTYPVKDFSEFVAGGETNIEIIQDDREYLRVEADAEVMKRVKVDQTGKRVSVWVKSEGMIFNWFGHGRGDGRVRIVLHVKHLEYLELSGAAEAKVGNLQEDRFEISGSGAAEATFATMNAARFRADLSGAANVRIHTINSQEQDFDLSGAADVHVKSASNTQSLTADVSGASNLRAKMITAKTARVHASGASHIELNVTSELDAGASGASSVNYYGQPKARTEASGASHIAAKN